MPVPPKLVRRLVIAPLVVLFELALLVLSPLLLLVAAIAIVVLLSVRSSANFFAVHRARRRG